MTNRIERSCALALLALLAGCAPSMVAAPPAPRQPQPVAYPQAGLEVVLGRNAAALQAAFGRPDLDVREGDARKLQFLSPICVLDTYLYAPPRGGDPVVTHVDARLPDGRDMDRASCVAALVAERQRR